ncbi:cellulose synthase [Nocardiopsis mangrovi]|uniref:Cellulose synthase n=1 Tax=Nocardiopsis mangrovi TaxID=1179818 RepID=A0ABV9E2N5_9ACTN
MPEQLPIAGPMLGAALTVVGLLISWVVWRRSGAASGLRAISWSLLPLAVGLMGLMSILWRLVFELFGFFVGLVFNPMVWAGVAVAALAAVLWVVSGVMRNRGVGGAKDRSGGSGQPKSAESGRGPAAGIGAPQPGAGGAAKPAKGPAAKKGADDDLGDIEDLLRKHGIE